MKRINKKTLERKFLRTESHMRWACDSTDAIDGTPATYFFAFSGPDTVIKKTRDSVFSELRNYGGVDIIRDDIGRVKGTNYEYHLYVVESKTSDNMIENLRLDIPKKKDPKMYDRKRKMYIRHDGVAISFSVENYVADLNNK